MTRDQSISGKFCYHPVTSDGPGDDFDSNFDGYQPPSIVGNDFAANLSSDDELEQDTRLYSDSVPTVGECLYRASKSTYDAVLEKYCYLYLLGSEKS